MVNNINQLLSWLKVFQTVWLPENLPNDSHLLQSIQTKLREFEQLILENTDEEEEYHRARLLEDLSASNSETEHIPIASTSTHRISAEQSLNLLQQADDENDEVQARQILLEQSDASENDDEVFLRPTIRLKRISLTDAERFMPPAWKNENNQRILSSIVASEESSMSNSTSEEDGDYTIKYRTRNSRSKKSEKSSIQLRPTTRHFQKKSKEIFINYNPSALLNEPTVEDSLTIAEEVGPMDEDRILNEIIENNDNESLFEALDITQEKPMETNPPDERVDEPDDQISTQDSSDDRALMEVPSYSHLLHHSKLTSSDTDNSKKTRSSKKTKRVVSSPLDSDASPAKKKSKVPKRRRAALSFSSSNEENENDRTLTTRDNASPSSSSQSSSPHTSSRIRIQRSSSEDSNESPSKRSIKRRHKTTTSTERSNILKEIKRKTREKRDSKSSSSASDDDGDRSRTKKSSEIGDESTSNEDELSPSKGRKNIRKILDDRELNNQTKDAIAAERERRKRIAENQKKYNDSLVEQSSSQLDASTEQIVNVNPRLILDIDKNTNEPLIEVSPKLVEQMKAHQCDGVRFLWNNVFESVDAIQNRKHPGNGCILAHCMGLGKTLQVISLIHTVFNYQKFTNVKTCLVLCPINAALNWSNEFDSWLNGIEPPIDHYQLTTIKTHLRVAHLNYWHENGGVMVMGYEMYRRFANGIQIKNKTTKDALLKYLVDPGPDIIVADEGHILKNSQTSLAKCLSKIKTRRRIVLTGTPLQNNLIEYYCMVTFIKPKLLGSQSEYINRFVNPIQNGQHRDSNEEDVRLMKRRACVLHELLTGFVDRKDYSLLTKYLPTKYEYVIKIRLSDLQSRLYQIYLEKFVKKEQRTLGLTKKFHSTQLFNDYNYLYRICAHPFLLYPHFIERWKKECNKDDDSLIDENESEVMFLDNEEDVQSKKKKANKKQEKSPMENSYRGFLIDNIKNEQTTTNQRHPSTSSTTTLDSDAPLDNGENSKSSDDSIEVIRTYPTRSRTTTNEEVKSSPEEDNSNEPWLHEMREQFWFPFLDMLPEESQFDIELSGKFLLLKYFLDKCTEIGDKIIVFSRSILSLNHIEKFLKHLHTHNEKEYRSQREYRKYLSSEGESEPIPEPIQWIRERDYFRMDGRTDVTARKRYTKTFNNTSNTRGRLFLISTVAGGIGVNLVGGNRVIVFDASWNPSHDTQAVFRAFRFGQKKPVYIYRFLASGTMEEKIYQRQVVKQSLSQRVIDDHQLDRHFTQNDITELYNFQPELLPQAPTTSTALNFNYAIPKDHLLLDLLYEHNRWIHSYHSHDSLLENRIDEGLTADERRRALEEYENLKRLPDPRQIALERFQQQQRLNHYIAQQQSAAQIPAANPYRLQPLPNMNGQFTQVLQHLQSMGMMHGTSTPTTAHPVPIQPRPAISNITNDPIVVESDEELPDDILAK